MNRRPAESGFTLLELLVAMAMMTLIVSMVYGSYAATSQSLEVHSDRLTSSQRASFVLRLMARQIRCAYGPAAEPNATDPADASELLAKQTRPIFRGGGKHPRGEFLSFVTTAGLGTTATARGGLSRVTFRYEAQTETLAMTSRPYTTEQDQKASNESWSPVLGYVTNLSVEFHDGQKWLPNWDAKPAKELPHAVKIALTTVDEKGRPHHIGTTIPVLSRRAGTLTISTKKTGGRSL